MTNFLKRSILAFKRRIASSYIREVYGLKVDDLAAYPVTPAPVIKVLAPSKKPVLRPITITTRHMKGSGYNASLFVINDGYEYPIQCDYKEGIILLNFRELLLSNKGVKELLAESKKLFLQQPTDYLYYTILKADINSIKTNGTKDIPNFDYIVQRNDDWLRHITVH